MLGQFGRRGEDLGSSVSKVFARGDVASLKG